MGKVFFDLAMSLDGYISGPDARPGNPLGDGGERLHTWMYRTAAFMKLIGRGNGGETGPDDDLVRRTIERAGASVMGRRMFDEGEVGWPEEAPFHHPVFVVTSRAREPWVRKGGTTFTFVTDGVESALAQAKAAAGGKDVRVSGGASLVRQCLAAGVIDEGVIHLAPVLLGAGIRLFDGLPDAAGVGLDGPVAHLDYRITR
ncbi:dihydrofolate reductase [Nonomuraea terrae]|uniref:Dihydrofolate reductase n=1 Tax=Nonomuraea terrae TaxID=2530383 RepID=A0A4R4YBA7_9ACTN|nr:dihydrofolate reductase family protein [Nonomuraea terrae]TDD41330.1 dihydrofolate reductase [Nonomuraea terrae]